MQHGDKRVVFMVFELPEISSNNETQIRFLVFLTTEVSD